MSGTSVTMAVTTFLFSIPILTAGIWLGVRGRSDCDRFLDVPFIVTGLLLMGTSITGLTGLQKDKRWLVSLYLYSTLFLLLTVLGLTAFAFAAAHRSSGEVEEGVGYQDFYLGSSSNWLQKRVTGNWERISRCLKKRDACGWMLQNSDSFDQFIQRDLGGVQSGCCKPPWECGFSFGNATTWYPRADKNVSSNPDCGVWSNDHSKLCYDCQSCKAGVMSNLKSHWRKMAILVIVFLSVLLVVIHPIAWFS